MAVARQMRAEAEGEGEAPAAESAEVPAAKQDSPGKTRVIRGCGASVARRRVAF